MERINKTDDILEELKKCEGEQDLVCTLFKATEQVTQIRYPYNIWLKFDGEADNRLAANTPFSVTSIQAQGKVLYLSNYPLESGLSKKTMKSILPPCPLIREVKINQSSSAGDT